MSELIKKGISAICYLLEVFKNQYHYQCVSKGVIQKLLFLFAENFNYEWGYYLKNSWGPHSELVDSFLSWAEARGYIIVKRCGKNTFIIIEENPFDCLNADEKENLKQIVKNFHYFDIEELEIITIAVYMQNKFQMNDKKMIIDSINESRPFMNRKNIKKLVEVVI